MRHKVNLTAVLILLLANSITCDNNDEIITKSEPSIEIKNQKSANTQDTNEVVRKINDLTQKIFTLIEPMSQKTSKEASNANDDTYFLSFILRDRSNQAKQSLNDSNTRKMTVNNNFNGERLAPSQVFVERGTSANKEPPAHNIQMMGDAMNQQKMKQPRRAGHDQYNPMFDGKSDNDDDEED